MEQWACTTGDSSNLWHHGSEGTEADHSPLLSTLPTNSTCSESESDPCKYGNERVRGGGEGSMACHMQPYNQKEAP